MPLGRCRLPLSFRLAKSPPLSRCYARPSPRRGCCQKFPRPDDEARPRRWSRYTYRAFFAPAPILPEYRYHRPYNRLFCPCFSLVFSLAIGVYMLAQKPPNSNHLLSLPSRRWLQWLQIFFHYFIHFLVGESFFRRLEYEMESLTFFFRRFRKYQTSQCQLEVFRPCFL